MNINAARADGDRVVGGSSHNGRVASPPPLVADQASSICLCMARMRSSPAVVMIEEQHRGQRRAHGVVTAAELLEHDRVDRLGRVAGPTVGQHEDAVEHLQAVQEVQHRGDGENGLEQRQRDVPNSLNARRPVDASRVVVLARNRLEAGQQQQHDEPDALPGVDGDDRVRGEIAGRSTSACVSAVESDERRRNDSTRRSSGLQDRLEDDADDDHRQASAGR